MKTTNNITTELIVNRYYEEYATVMISDEIRKKVHEMAEEVANKIIDNYEVQKIVNKKGIGLSKGQIALIITLKPKNS